MPHLQNIVQGFSTSPRNKALRRPRDSLPALCVLLVPFVACGAEVRLSQMKKAGTADESADNENRPQTRLTKLSILNKPLNNKKLWLTSKKMKIQMLRRLFTLFSVMVQSLEFIRNTLTLMKYKSIIWRKVKSAPLNPSQSKLIPNSSAMENKNHQIAQAKGLAKWFSVDITIKIFGVTIWEYHFPPKTNNND